MIRVFIAEDAPTVARLYRLMLEGTPDIVVVGEANTGVQARERVRILKPDLLMTDLWMPDLDGFGLIAWVMANQPLPILVLSNAVDGQGQETVVRCLALGALEARAKPLAGTPEQFAQSRAELQRLVRTLAGVRVVRRWTTSRPELPVSPAVEPDRPEVIAIGASTGGPQVIQVLVERLPRSFPIPILLALHIGAGFTDGLVSWLRTITPLDVRSAADSDVLEPGTIVVPPERRHLVVAARAVVRCAAAGAGEGLVPSIDRLFASVAAVYRARACGVLLTGMGRDGAVGLGAIRTAGGRTFGQDGGSCVVNGMPQAALDLGAVQVSLPPDGLAGELLRMGGA